MGAIRIDGKAFADALVTRIADEAAALQARRGLVPGLAVVLVGEDPASQVYVRNKGLRAEACGFLSRQYRLPVDTSQDELLDLIGRLNGDRDIHGILVQLPLPAAIDAQRVLAAIDPAKDVDGFHPVNAGRLAQATADAVVPCTPLGCLMLLKDQLGDLSGRDALIIGRSTIVGRPMAMLLVNESATVTIAHSRTRDLPALARRADILVAAVGRPEMVPGNWIKPGATVIDVGINRVPAPDKGEGKTRLVGDVDYASAAAVAGAITPVPGGVGPMTIACLLQNTLAAAQRQGATAC